MGGVETWVQNNEISKIHSEKDEIADYIAIAVRIKPSYPSLRAKGNTKPPRQRSTWRHMLKLEAISPSSYTK